MEHLTAWGSRVAAVGVAPSFAFRATLIPIVALGLGGSRWMRQTTAANVVLAAAFFASVQILARFRADLETLGFVAFGMIATVEALNAWRFWKEPERQVNRSALIALMVLSSITLAQWVPPVRPHRQNEVRFWWPTAPLPEFATVDAGYGWNRIGHIGEFPRLLERAGFSVTKRSDLNDLRSRLLVLPVPFRSMKPLEIAAVRDFAWEGGRLLLIGEHTNLQGVQDDFNRVLAGTGLSLNFDTTNAVFGDSTVALSGPHVNRNSYITHNRGASVFLSGFRAVPLLVGSWWHADGGDALAPERAYLSDYRLSPGDRVGGVVLAATAPFGRGRFVLWGDGSPFLNQNVLFNSRFLLDIVDSLTGDSGGRWIAPVGAMIFLLLWIVSGRTEVLGVMALVAVLVPIVWAYEADLPLPTAVVSDAENNGFDRDAFSANGVTALGVSLTRAGFVPWLGDWRTLAAPPRVLLIVNPNRIVTRRFVGQIRQLAQSGGTVVITGAGDSPSFLALAEAFESRVVGPPIGSIRGAQFKTYSAWRLESAAGTALTAGTTPVGVTMSIGKGRLTLIADPGLFLSKNLETENEYDPQNLQFLRKLISLP